MPFWGGGVDYTRSTILCEKLHFFKMTHRFYNHVSTVLKCTYSTTIYLFFYQYIFHSVRVF